MRDAVIATSVRTAVGKSGRGALATTRPDDLAATAIEGALARLPQLDRNEIEDVIFGCAMPEAEQGMNVARIAALREEHQDLDDAVSALEALPMPDQLQIARLKKKKLTLRDQIAKLEDKLTPDIIA